MVVVAMAAVVVVAAGPTDSCRVGHHREGRQCEWAPAHDIGPHRLNGDMSSPDVGDAFPAARSAHTMYKLQGDGARAAMHSITLWD
jgi:hypothetical protein